MAQNDMEPTLRKALDAVNSGRKWTIVGIAALFFAVLIVLATLNRMIMPPSSGIDVSVPGSTAVTSSPATITRVIPVKALWVSAAMQLFFVACGTAAIMLHVSRMTRTILRAIESVKR